MSTSGAGIARIRAPAATASRGRGSQEEMLPSAATTRPRPYLSWLTRVPVHGLGLPKDV